jgi:long-chain acyl-CoA synthetase
MPLPGTDVDLRSDGSDWGPGRVFVRGPAVALGYASVGETSAETDAAFVDSGFLTGDLGQIDTAGRLTLVGRVSSFINVAGRKVDPAEVEAVLRSMPGVADVVVIGVPCDARGERVAACVRPVSGPLSEVEVRAFCAARLAAHKVPRHVANVTQWPVDARGKVDRRAMARDYNAGVTRERSHG